MSSRLLRTTLVVATAAAAGLAFPAAPATAERGKGGTKLEIVAMQAKQGYVVRHSRCAARARDL